MNLNDLTFIIPVGIETKDRLRNFLFIIKYLQKICPECKIIIHEMGDEQYSYNITGPNIIKLFTKTDKNKGIFYKTKCINEALILCTTKVVCIYDVDVLIPRNSIELSVSEILNGCDMVLPFGNGKFQKQILNFNNSEDFYNTLDFNVFTEINLNFSFYGHIQFFNTKSFCEVGGENEEMIGWAPEDQEKLYKMQNLGYRVKYLDNMFIWHIEHERTNPTYWLTDLHNKNVQIFEKIKNMSVIEQKEYYLNQANTLLKKKETHVSTI